jgi:hypothetical protein
MAIADVERVLHDITYSRAGQAGYGDPLYMYKVTEADFDRLATELRTVTVADFTRHSICKKAFVLYASTWWNRRYQGGHWAWEPIFASIGPNCNVDPNNRSDYIRQGLRSWGLEPVAIQRAYLGAIVYNGGIPNHILTMVNGPLPRFISKIIQAAPVNAVLEDFERIASRSANDWGLPVVYQQVEFFKLVAELLVQLKHLVPRIPDIRGVDRVSQLDQVVPNWRDKLPLVLDSVASCELVNQITGNIHGNSGQVPFPVVRQWVREGDVWFPQIHIEKRSKVTKNDLLRQFGQFDGTPKAIEFSINGQVTIYELFRDHAVQGQYHVKGRDLKYRCEVATPVSVVLRLADDRELFAKGNHFKPLDCSQIWRLHGDIGERRVMLKSVGAFRTSAKSVLVSIPHDSVLDCDIDPVCNFEGRDCYYLDRTSTVVSADGTHYVMSIGVNAEDGIDVEYDLEVDVAHEHLLWSSIPICSENPRVQQFTDALSFDYVPRERIAYGTRRARPGVSRVRVVQDATVIWSADYILLPAFSISRIAFAANYVSFSIIGLGQFSPTSVDQGLEMQWEGNCLTIRTLTAGPLPPSVSVTCTNLVGIRLTLLLACPLPQPLLVMANGVNITDQQTVSLHDFASARFYCDSTTREEVVVVLKNELQVDDSETRLVTTLGYTKAGRNDLSLGRLWDKVELLLSETDNLDSGVKIRLEIGVQPLVEFRVGRFGYRLTPIRQDSRVIIEPSNVTSEVSLVLVNFDDSLPVRDLCQVSPTEWIVDLLGLSGPSIIVPDNACQLSIRSLLWTSNSEQQPRSTLLSAMFESDPALRENRIRFVMSELASNIRHPDWETCFQLLEHVKHLPLSTLDFVRLSIREPDFLVMFVLTLPTELSETVLPRLEIELPFIWEMVPVSAWRNAFGNILNDIPPQFMGAFYERLYLRIRQFAGGRSVNVARSLRPGSPVIDWERVRIELIAPGACAQINELRIRMANMADVHVVTPTLQGNILNLFEMTPDIWGAASRSLTTLIAAPVLAAFAQSLPFDEFASTFDNQTIMSLKLIRSIEPEWYDHAYQFCLESAGVNNNG